MNKVDGERAAVRRLRESLGLSRPEFSVALKDHGLHLTANTLESYEKDVPADNLVIFAKIARDHGWLDIAADLEPSDAVDASIIYPKNAKWHKFLDEILADPEERLGIEKNLGWAVAAIRAKATSRSNSAGRGARERLQPLTVGGKVKAEKP